jgi:hypothetical protein
MKSAISKLAQALLAAAAIGLLAALAVPWTEPPVAGAPSSSTVVPSALPAPDAGRTHAVSPQAVAALFAKPRAPATAAAVPQLLPRPEERKPVDAPWLSYLGFYSDAPGAPCILLKDTRNGRVIRVPASGDSSEWSLLENSDKRMIIRNGSDIYVVVKR